jgi:hypothetical protein
MCSMSRSTYPAGFVLIICTPYQISVFINDFWVITQKLQFYPLCSIYRHGGHDGWSAGSSEITFKGNTLRMIQAKFGLNWSSGFRGEDFWKRLDGQRTPSDANSSHQDLPTRQGLKLAVAHSPFASKFQCGPLKISSQSSTWRVKIRKNKMV